MDPDFLERFRNMIRSLREGIPELPRRQKRTVPTVEEARANPGRAISPALLDSISRALGTEDTPVVSTSLGLANVGGGFFDPGPGAVVVNPVSVENAALARPKNVQHLSFVDPGPGKHPSQVEPRQGEVLAHELAHAATVDGFDFRPGTLGGFTARFLDKFSSLPESTQAKHYAAYAPGFTYLGTEDQKQEIVAKTLERGFSIARVADPDDPQQVAALVDQVEKEFPGTREAYNFWIRRLRPGGSGPARPSIPVRPIVEAADAAPPAPQRPSGPPTPGRRARRFSR